MPNADDWTYDEVVLAAELVRQNDWKDLRRNDPRVLELSTFLQAVHPLPMAERSPAFRNANGVARKTHNIVSHHPDFVGTPSKGGSWEAPVVQQFLNDPAEMVARAEQIRAALSEVPGILGFESDQLDDEFDAAEGRVLVAIHRRRERSRALRDRKLKQALATGSPVTCQVCHRDLTIEYSAVGLAEPMSLFDVHHVVPLSAKQPGTTKLSDLVVVCPTCHRALHRMKPWGSPEQLRAALGK